jgi:hypothetical protein
MGMIDRYKKKGGFLQLVNLIETTGTDKREKFLKMIADESPTWEAAIKQKMLTIDKVCRWQTSVLMEIMPQIPHVAIACAIFPLPDDKKVLFLSALGFGDRRRVEDLMKESKPNSGEVAASQFKILAEVRSMISSGKLKMDKIDPELFVPDNFEEQLAGGMVDVIMSSPMAMNSAESAATVASATAGANNATEELTMLRKKLVALTQENNFLKKETKDLREKIENIKETLKKIA